MADEKVTVSARIPAGINAAADALAKRQGRSKSWLVTEGLKLVLARSDDRDIRTMVGLSHLASGNTVPHQKLQADWAGAGIELVWTRGAEYDLDRVCAALASLRGTAAGERARSVAIAEATRLLLQPMSGELQIGPQFEDRVRQTVAGGLVLRYHYAGRKLSILTVDEDGLLR